MERPSYWSSHWLDLFMYPKIPAIKEIEHLNLTHNKYDEINKIW